MTKNPKSSAKTIIQDAETLTTESAFAEVWEIFEKALSQLESESPESSALLSGYLSGTPEAELAKQTQLSEGEVRNWIRKIKRDLNQQLRQGCKVRQ